MPLQDIKNLGIQSAKFDTDLFAKLAKFPAQIFLPFAQRFLPFAQGLLPFAQFANLNAESFQRFIERLGLAITRIEPVAKLKYFTCQSIDCLCQSIDS